MGAIITASSTIGAALLHRIGPMFPLNAMAKHRRDKLHGVWSGMVTERNYSAAYPIRITLRVLGRRIFGTAAMEWGSGASGAIRITGSALDDHYLVFHYSNSNRSVKHYGTGILMLNDAANQLEGDVLWAGMDSPTIRRASIEVSPLDC